MEGWGAMNICEEGIQLVDLGVHGRLRRVGGVNVRVGTYEVLKPNRYIIAGLF